MWLSPVTGIDGFFDCASARGAIAATGRESSKFLLVMCRSVSRLTVRSILSGSFAKRGEQFFRRNHCPGLEHVRGKLIVTDAFEFDSDPAFHADIGRAIVDSGRFLNESFLETGGSGNPDRHVSIVMMIVGEHREDTFAAGEKCRLAV